MTKLQQTLVPRQRVQSQPVVANSQSSIPAAEAEPATAERDPEPAAGERVDDATPQDHRPRSNPLRRFFGGYWRKKLWTLPLTLVVLVGIIAGVPYTRYSLLAAFVKRAYVVTVEDNKTNTPVSGASVRLDEQTMTTDSAGVAKFTAPVGPHTLSISKKYYQDAQQGVFVDLGTAHNAVQIELNATGRQVPIKVIDKISGQPLPNASVRVAGSDVTTGHDGTVTIVLPTSSPTLDAELSADGYTNLTGKVQITSDVVAANTFALVPAGRVYFLSNQSGKIDVVSTKLDGTDRKTVVAGTGWEDANNTVLLASRDWQYLVLSSKRDGGNLSKLFLINTANDTLTQIDDGMASSYTPIGWDNHYFVYQATYPNPSWMSSGTVIQSYNADNNKYVHLAVSTAKGTSNADAQYQNFWDTVIIGDNLAYVATWYTYPGVVGATGQQNSLVLVSIAGGGSKTIKSVDATTYYFNGLRLASPNFAYVGVYSTGGSNANFYKLDTNGNLSQSNTISADTLNKDYPTYLESPSDKFTFWTEPRDGKDTLFTGDTFGNNATQIATLSDYAPYGWYTDSYLLVQKSGSQLYVMPAAGGTPVKIADYYKVAVSFEGYGGGYGGL